MIDVVQTTSKYSKNQPLHKAVFVLFEHIVDGLALFVLDIDVVQKARDQREDNI